MTDVPLYYSKDLFLSMRCFKTAVFQPSKLYVDTVNLKNILWTIMCPCYYSFFMCNSSMLQHLMAMKTPFTNSSLGGMFSHHMVFFWKGFVFALMQTKMSVFIHPEKYKWTRAKHHKNIIVNT